MEIRQLRQFIAVAEERHFRRAAERLNMAQPPLSQAIQRLESELEVKLFHRTNRHVELTRAGEVFLGEIRRVLDQIDLAVTSARRTAEGLLGRLRICFNSASSFELVPRILLGFRERMPNIELDLQEMTSAEQVKPILEGRVDAGFLRATAFEAEDIVFESLWRDFFVAAIPENHRLADLPKISLHQLRNEFFLVTPSWLGPSFFGPSFHARVMAACQSAGFTPRIAHEANQMQTIPSLVAAGLGVALVPASLRQLRRDGVVYKSLRERSPLLELDLGVAWNKTNESPILTTFLRLAREVAQHLPE